ncbi:MAG: hypothetical protein OEY14_18255, partial [Myxococcales bacterium]|nr:hypothetical protein [Myxococcales bacterium]
ADLYALGVIYFEMLTGRLPFEANEITGFFIKHMQDPPPKPSELVADCPRRLETLILALLEKKPEDRPVDAHQIIKELQALAPAARPSVGPPIPTSARAVAAPTLPPTTLDRWARRTALFDEMLRRAFPSGDAPAPIAALLEQIRASLRRVHELRSSGLKEQRKLEQMEGLAREGRERLGFAVQSLAEDLSQARADARQAQHDVAPYFESDAQAQAAQAEALRAVTAILGGGEPLAEPSEPLARALRAGADALDRWSLAYGPAIKARRWVESKEQLVTDLQFQVDALRAQLERSEASFDRDRAASEQILIEGSQEAERCEQALLLTASDFCAALRPRRELGDLFERLEADAG